MGVGVEEESAEVAEVALPHDRVLVQVVPGRVHHDQIGPERAHQTSTGVQRPDLKAGPPLAQAHVHPVRSTIAPAVA